MENSIFKHFTIIGSGTLISMVISLITAPIITRIVNPAEYGELSMFTLYANIALMVFCLGLDQSFVRYYYQSNTLQYKRKLLFNSWIIPVIVFCIFGTIFYILSLFSIVTFDFSPSIIGLLVIFTLIQIINRFCTLVLRLEYKSKLYSIINIVQKALYLLIAIALVLLVKEDYFYWLVFATIISVLIVTLVGIAFENEIWRFKKINIDLILDPQLEESIKIKNLLKYGLPFIVSLGITTVFQAIDKIAINHFYSYNEVGIYASAMSLVNIFAIIQTTFTTLWAPLSVEHFEKYPKDKSFYQKGNQVITVVMFIFGVTLILFKDIFVIILGSAYRDSAYILPFLIFYPIMYTISETTVNGIVFFKKSGAHIIVAIGSLLINLIGAVILIPYLGLKGAAISTGISYICFFVLRTIISNKHFYIDFKLKNFFILTLVTMIYALYNMFYPFNILTVIGYILLLLLIFVLYRDIINFIFSSLRKRFRTG